MNANPFAMSKKPQWEKNHMTDVQCVELYVVAL
jgi:hypothetical protein